MRLNQSVAQLNSFLHEEMSATGAYKKAMDFVKDEAIRKAIEKLERAHEQRIETLKRMIVSRGGHPADSSPAWNVQSGDGVRLIDELERMEDQELADYRREIVAVDPDARSYLERSVIPELERTRDELERIKKTLH